MQVKFGDEEHVTAGFHLDGIDKVPGSDGARAYYLTDVDKEEEDLPHEEDGTKCLDKEVEVCTCLHIVCLQRPVSVYLSTSFPTQGMDVQGKVNLVEVKRGSDEGMVNFDNNNNEDSLPPPEEESGTVVKVCSSSPCSAVHAMRVCNASFHI